MNLTENKLALLCAVLAVIGIIGLLLISAGSSSAAKFVSIKEISSDLIEKKIEVIGIIKKISIREKTAQFELADETDKNFFVKAIMFSPTIEQKKQLFKENKIKAIGIAREFKKELELVVEKIIPLELSELVE